MDTNKESDYGHQHPHQQDNSSSGTRMPGAPGQQDTTSNSTMPQMNPLPALTAETQLYARVAALETQLRFVTDRNVDSNATEYFLRLGSFREVAPMMSHMFPVDDRSQHVADLRKSQERAWKITRELSERKKDRARLEAELGSANKELIMLKLHQASRLREVRQERAILVKALLDHKRARGNKHMRALALKLWRQAWEGTPPWMGPKDSNGKLINFFDEEEVCSECEKLNSFDEEATGAECDCDCHHDCDVDGSTLDSVMESDNAGVDRTTTDVDAVQAEPQVNVDYEAEDALEWESKDVEPARESGGPQLHTGHQHAEPATEPRGPQVNVGYQGHPLFNTGYQHAGTPLYYRHGLFFKPFSRPADLQSPSQVDEQAVNSTGLQPLKDQAPGWARPLSPTERPSSPDISLPPMSCREEFTQPSEHHRTVIVTHLPNSVTPSDLIRRVRGGMLVKITMMDLTGFMPRLNRYGIPLDSKEEEPVVKCGMSAMIIFLDGHAAHAWVEYVTLKPQILEFAAERSNEELITIFMDPAEETQKISEQPGATTADQAGEEAEEGELVDIYLADDTAYPAQTEDPSPTSSLLYSAMTESSELGQRGKSILATATLLRTPTYPMSYRLQRSIEEGHTRVIEIQKCPGHVTKEELADMLKRDRNITRTEIEDITMIVEEREEPVAAFEPEDSDDETIRELMTGKPWKGKTVEYRDAEVARASMNRYRDSSDTVERAPTTTATVTFLSIEAASLAYAKLLRHRLFSGCRIRFMDDPCAGPLEELRALL